MESTLTKICSSLFMMFVVLGLQAQSVQLKGTVSNEEGEPLIGATVVVKGSSVGTITNFDGMYNMTVEKGKTLLFSYVGFESKEVTVGDQSEINVILGKGKELDEVVVTALGISREKKALGYAVQELDGDDLAQTREPNLINSLRGKVAGVNIQGASGAPGAGSNIVIRGINSLSPGANNQPLFVVDGIPISNQTIAGNQLPSAGSNSPSSREQSSFTNRAADINPDDVESISILKGPSATALYGLRAANGVVLITTKRGKEGRAKVSVTSNYGWENLGQHPDYQSEYREGRFGRLRFRSNGDPLRFQSFGPKVYEGQTPVFDPVEDFFETGSKFGNTVSISGGSEKATYHSSFSHLNHNGIVPFSNWERFSARLSATLKVSETFSVNGQVNYINSGGLKPHSGDKSIFSSLSYHPTSFDINDYVNPDGSMKDYSDGIIDNPRFLAEFSQLEDNVNRVIGGLGFNYNPTSWFELSYVGGIDQYSDQRGRVIPPGIDLSSQTGGFIIDERVNYLEFNSNLLATFKKSISDFDLSFTAGHSLTDIRTDVTNVRGENFAEPSFFDLSNSSVFFSSNNFSQSRLIGLLGIFKADWNDQVYFELTGRNDWSSTLPEENRSFFYPSASLAWVATEAFDIPAVNFAKLRLSWAQVGKDAQPYQVGQYFGTGGNFPFGGVVGFGNSTLVGDANLEPEITTSVEVGAEIRMLNNKVGLDITYFNQLSDNMIFEVPISNATGFSRYITNAGSIRNTGVEILANVNVFDKKDFGWDVSLNWSTVQGEVESIREGIDEIVYFDAFYISNRLEEGGEFGDLYGWPLVRDAQGNVVLNENGYPEVNFDQPEKVGNAMPDWIAGLTNTLRYKDFSFSFLLDWRHGGDMYDMGMRNSIRNGVHPWTQDRYQEVVFKGVDGEGNTNTEAVEINGETLYRVFGGVNTSSDVVLQDASWFRLRRVSLGYRLPRRILNKIGDNLISEASLLFAANNVWVNTPFVGFDPEMNYFGSGSNIMGFTGLQTPVTRSYDITLRVTF